MRTEKAGVLIISFPPLPTSATSLTLLPAECPEYCDAGGGAWYIWNLFTGILVNATYSLAYSFLSWQSPSGVTAYKGVCNGHVGFY